MTIGAVMMMRILVRLAILGLAVYGAKRLYDTYFGSADEAKDAGSAMADRVGQASERVKKEARDAASEVAAHARAVSEEIRDTATDVVDLSDPTGAGDEQPQPRPV
jgi:gas vesicle protein